MTRRLPDLYELIAADARLTEPTPPGKRVTLNKDDKTRTAVERLFTYNPH